MKHFFQITEPSTNNGRRCQSWSRGQDVTAGEEESKEGRADVGSGTTSQGDLAKAQSMKFPQTVTSPKWAPI